MPKQPNPLFIFPIFVLIEIVLLVLVGQWTGGLWVVAWTVLSFFLGTRVWASLREGGPLAARALWSQGAQDPSAMTEVAVNSMLLGLAGLLLVIPGLLTDLAGLLLVVPPIRRGVVSAFMQRALGKRAPRSANRARAKTEREPWDSGFKARRSAHATVDVEVIPPEHAPQSPFEHVPRIINVDPGAPR